MARLFNDGANQYLTCATTPVTDEPFTLAAGELFRLKVTRDATNDDAAGDAELHAIEIRES